MAQKTSDECQWCHILRKPLNSATIEWTVLDDDFCQPVTNKLIHYCFHCGRRLDKEDET